MSSKVGLSVLCSLLPFAALPHVCGAVLYGRHSSQRSLEDLHS